MQAINKKKIIEAGFGYTIGNILLKGINFLTVPLFTYLMSTNDYGKFSVYISYESVFFIIIGFALHVSIKNAKYDYKKEYKNYLSNCVYLICLSFIFYIIVLNLFHNKIFTLLDLDLFTLNCLLIHSFSTAIITFYSDKIALDYEYKKYLSLSFISTSINIILSLFFIIGIFHKNRYWGRVLGSSISNILIAVYIIFIFFKQSFPSININYWKYALKISLPIVPHGISQIVLSSFDRIMINQIIGSSHAGIYSMTYTVSTILQVLFASIDKIWSPWFFNKMNNYEIELIKKRTTIMLFLTSIITCLLVLISPEIISFLAPKAYWDGKKMVMVVLLGIYFSLIYTFPANVEYFYKKTIYIAVGTFISALINILLNAIFIPQFGYIAASYTTLVTYFIYFIFHMCLSKKLANFYVFNIKFGGIIIVSTCIITILSKVFINFLIIRLFIVTLIIIASLYQYFLYKTKKKKESNLNG